MFGLGIQELIIIILILLFLIGPAWVSIYLRKKAPNKKWLAIVLSILFCPFGHLYLKGATGYILTLIVLAIISNKVPGGFALPLIASPLMMWYRFSKIVQVESPVKGSD